MAHPLVLILPHIMELKNSPVIYDPVPHTYTLNGVQLHGITGLISRKLFPDKYAGVPRATLDKAAERGSRIHNVIQCYEESGGFLTNDDSQELKGYIFEAKQNPFMSRYLTNEYVVSDEKQYASPVDMVYETLDGTGVILADIKTTSKFDKEYVAWQLSVYADWFEAMNPGIPVQALYAIWLKDDKHKVVEVERKSHEEVEALLYGEIEPQKEEFSPEELPEIADKEKHIAYLTDLIKEMTEELAAVKAQVCEAMIAANAKTYNGTLVKITRKQDSERLAFDTKAFKAADPDTYSRYLKKSISKGGLTITNL